MATIWSYAALGIMHFTNLIVFTRMRKNAVKFA